MIRVIFSDISFVFHLFSFFFSYLFSISPYFSPIRSAFFLAHHVDEATNAEGAARREAVDVAELQLAGQQ